MIKAFGGGNNLFEENEKTNEKTNEKRYDNTNKLNDPFGNQDFNKENEDDDPFADDVNIEIKNNKISNVNQTK